MQRDYIDLTISVPIPKFATPPCCTVRANFGFKALVDSRMMRERRKTMTAHYQGSAKIYDFPLRGRFAVGASHPDSDVAAKTAPRAPAISFGSWYHEEAIEAERTRRN